MGPHSARRKERFHVIRSVKQPELSGSSPLPRVDVVTRWDSKEAEIGRLFLLERVSHVLLNSNSETGADV
jgi:hypothetical protein